MGGIEKNQEKKLPQEKQAKGSASVEATSSAAVVFLFLSSLVDFTATSFCNTSDHLGLP